MIASPEKPHLRRTRWYEQKSEGWNCNGHFGPTPFLAWLAWVYGWPRIQPVRIA